MESPATDWIAPLFLGLDERVTGLINIQGRALDEKEAVAYLFGASAKIEPWDVGANRARRLHWFETTILVRVDAAWYTKSALHELVGRLEAAPISVKLISVAGWTPIGFPGQAAPEPEYRLVALVRLTRREASRPPSRTSVGRGGSERSIERCGACGREHELFVSRKPQPGEERDTYEEYCLACARALIQIHTYGDYTLKLLPI